MTVHFLRTFFVWIRSNLKFSSKESTSKETDNETSLTDRTEILRSEISRTEAALSSSKRSTGSISSIEPEVISKRIESHIKVNSQSDFKDKSSDKSPRSSGTETITPSSSDNVSTTHATPTQRLFKWR